MLSGKRIAPSLEMKGPPTRTPGYRYIPWLAWQPCGATPTPDTARACAGTVRQGVCGQQALRQ
jgi:hypothetical protein